MQLICSADDVQGRDPVIGLDVAAAATALLAANGVSAPSEAELANAYAHASAEQGRNVHAVPAGAVNGALVAKANALLAKRLIFEPTEAEFLAAIAETSSVLDEPTGYRLTGVVQ